MSKDNIKPLRALYIYIYFLLLMHLFFFTVVPSIAALMQLLSVRYNTLNILYHCSYISNNITQ